MDTEQPAFFVVVDTNMFVYDTKLFGTPIGKVFQRILLSTGGALGMPEVLRMELVKHVAVLGRSHTDKVQRSLDTLGQLTARQYSAALPTDDWEQLAGSLIDNLKVSVEPVSFGESQARKAMEMVLSEVPPNGPKNQQFKDSAIWCAALDLAQRAPVHFVTSDKGFFEKGKGSERLAQNLRADVGRCPNSLLVHHTLAECITALGGAAMLDTSSFRQPIYESVNRILAAHFEQHEMGPISPIDSVLMSIQAFNTDDPSISVLTFELETEVSGETALVLTAIARGNCEVNIATETIETVYLDRIDVFDGDEPVPYYGVQYLRLPLLTV